MITFWIILGVLIVRWEYTFTFTKRPKSMTKNGDYIDEVEDGKIEDVKETVKNCEKKNQESKRRTW